LFVGADGKRKPIRLGKVSRKDAETFCRRVERIVSANITGTAPDDETSRWLAGLDDRTHGRLAAVGLVKPRKAAGETALGTFLDEYFAAAVVKPRTKITYAQARQSLID